MEHCIAKTLGQKTGVPNTCLRGDGKQAAGSPGLQIAIGALAARG